MPKIRSFVAVAAISASMLVVLFGPESAQASSTAVTAAQASSTAVTAAARRYCRPWIYYNSVEVSVLGVSCATGLKVARAVFPKKRSSYKNWRCSYGAAGHCRRTSGGASIVMHVRKGGD